MQEDIFTYGEDFFDALVSDIQSAEKSILLETYIFDSDLVGKRIAQALVDAASRGVKIQILIDGAGSPLWGGGGLARKLKLPDIEVRIFHPYPWGIWQWGQSVIRLPFLLKGIYLLSKMNARNHRKTCMIDDQIAYVGSFNITQCHLPLKKGGKDWRDTAVRLTHADLTPLKMAFEAAWEHRTIKEKVKDIFHHMNGDPIFRLNYSWNRRRILYKNLLKRIRHCEQRIWISNAYFMPDGFLLRKVKEAARKQVDVRILLPQKSDVFVMPWASSIFYESLLKAGVRIFEYVPSMLHTKILILDHWMTVGSTNLNHRSLLHDLEVDVNIQKPDTKLQIEHQFLTDLEHATEIQMENWIKRPIYQRIIGRLLLYLKFWM